MKKNKIRVVELFAGVGGFRIGLEGASDAYETIWNNQWEPSTQHQDASLVYQARFGRNGHCNKDINTVPTADIPNHDLLVGGFPCQDYSVAASLSRSGGIEGKKGVLWWQIHRILQEKGDKRPQYIFFENVDRLLNSPATQRGRDFAIILASLADLGYVVEWRIINAADYGMPQRRRRTYIVGYQKDSVVAKKIEKMEDWVEFDGVLAQAFPFSVKEKSVSSFDIEGTIKEVSDGFNKGLKETPFGNAGLMIDRHVYSVDAIPVYEGTIQTLGNVLVDEDFVPEEFFISEDELPKWKYEKGAKKINRVSKEGFEYVFSEGGMAFPDYLDKPSRTMITGEGGNAPSRFKHVVQTPSGRYRRLIPIELERLNMFPDNHTYHPDVSDGRRAFLMGNALVCGIVREIGKSLYRFIYDEAPASTHPIDEKRKSCPRLTLDLFANEETELVYNKPQKTYKLDSAKRLLIGFVKPDNIGYFLKEESSKLYYTDNVGNFPSTIALNKLYYFMPHIKGKGVRDLYLIKILRIGSKSEIYPDVEDTKAPRLVFELEYLESLPKYKMIHLNFQHSFTDTFLGKVMMERKNHRGDSPDSQQILSKRS
ncbi:MAG: DNA (cytosine-5-)-methyltransferase [Prevotella sp.]|nr:DNA (cytosine-5-)-methyltransferase [Prevotella sp.]